MMRQDRSMATTTAPHATTAAGRPVSTPRRDLAVALATLWLTGGLYLDGWAHSHVPGAGDVLHPVARRALQRLRGPRRRPGPGEPVARPPGRPGQRLGPRRLRARPARRRPLRRRRRRRHGLAHAARHRGQPRGPAQPAASAAADRRHADDHHPGPRRGRPPRGPARPPHPRSSATCRSCCAW